MLTCLNQIYAKINPVHYLGEVCLQCLAIRGGHHLLLRSASTAVVLSQTIPFPAIYPQTGPLPLRPCGCDIMKNFNDYMKLILSFMLVKNAVSRWVLQSNSTGMASHQVTCANQKAEVMIKNMKSPSLENSKL